MNEINMYYLKVVGIILLLTVMWFGSIDYALNYNDCEEISQEDVMEVITERYSDCDVFNMTGISPELDNEYITLDCLKGKA
jgi:hypothetical protein